MSFGIKFSDSDGRTLEIPGAWRIDISPAGVHQLIGEGRTVDLPSSLFGLNSKLSPEQLDEIRVQVEKKEK